MSHEFIEQAMDASSALGEIMHDTAVSIQLQGAVISGLGRAGAVDKCRFVPARGVGSALVRYIRG